jgi:F420-dependent oxidoreductase-like protein
VKIGLQIYHFDWPGSPQNIGSKLAEVARTADDAGFSSLWVMDHFFQIGEPFGPVEAPMLEGYSTLAYLAAVTRYINLGLMVTGAFYRPPGLLVKTVSTLDVLSGGRAILGIGAGWYQREADGLGMPYPERAGERVDRLEETLQIAKHMWAGDTVPFEGRYYRLKEPVNSPQPISKPHPPILIGGERPRMLGLVARYADAINLHLGTPLQGFDDWMQARYHNRMADLAGILDQLREACEQVGRPYEAIEKTTLATIQLGPGKMSCAEIVDLCQELKEIGFEHFIFNMPDCHLIDPLQRICQEVVPTVAAV